MRLKSFYGASMTEAMRQVREALGDNAIIIATRDDEKGGVRVTAAIDEPLYGETPAAPAPAPETNETDEALDIISQALLSHQLPSSLSEKLLASATQFAGEDPLLALGAALDIHFKFDPLALDKQTRPLALIGPPGAGKTLCAAKLATQATLNKTPVAVMSTDTERAGGMDQLSAFIRILKLDLIEIEDPHALQDAVAMQKAGTSVLIDTAGCNPYDPQDRARLDAFLKASGATPVLVLPADLDGFEAIDMVRALGALGATHLIPTRLDLTRRLGGLLRMAYETKLTLCQFSASPKVSEQPQPLNPVSLGRLILPKGKEPAKLATGTYR